jgi:serine phosphatase RsbU (regulator of sigma subunit)
MSLLGISLLNEIILKNNILSPDEIINNLRERLIKLLNPANENAELVRDGMDISVCTLNKETKEIHFAGANNKMLIVRTSTDEIVELDADSMPAGYYEVMKPFSLSTIKYIEGDVAVLFSDGYKDQFGGPDGKKFLIKRLKELLITVCKENSNPEMLLENAFLDWKGTYEQVDDVMVLGFYVNDLKE